MTLQEIADTADCKLTSTWKFLKSLYPPEFRKARKVQNYSKSKLGKLNPMSGKCRERHHNYIGAVSDGKGYHLILKPDWYTARKGTKHVFLHHVVMCEHLGLTEIPSGWCVHHKDENKINNEISNLELLTLSDHTKLHQTKLCK
jgi:hypothetical protein